MIRSLTNHILQRNAGLRAFFSRLANKNTADSTDVSDKSQTPNIEQSISESIISLLDNNFLDDFEKIQNEVLIKENDLDDTLEFDAVDQSRSSDKSCILPTEICKMPAEENNLNRFRRYLEHKTWSDVKVDFIAYDAETIKHAIDTDGTIQFIYKDTECELSLKNVLVVDALFDSCLCDCDEF